MAQAIKPEGKAIANKASAIAGNTPKEWKHGREYDGTCVVCGKEYELTRNARDVFAEMKVVQEIAERLEKELAALQEEEDAENDNAGWTE